MARSTLVGPAPSEAAVSSRPAGRERRAASSVMTRKGSETKTCAMTTAGVVKPMRTPQTPSSTWPTRPRRPKVVSSASPATTGGSDSGSATSTRAHRTPRQDRDSSTARGTPSTRSTAVAAAQVRRLSHRASREASAPMSSPKRPQGTAAPMPMRGITR